MTTVVRRARRELQIRKLGEKVTTLADELLLNLDNMNLEGTVSTLLEIVPTEVKLLKLKSEKAIDKFQDAAVQFFESSVIVALSIEDYNELVRSGVLNSAEYELLPSLTIEQAREKFGAVATAIADPIDRIGAMKAFLSDTVIIQRWKKEFLTPGWSEVV